MTHETALELTPLSETFAMWAVDDKNAAVVSEAINTAITQYDNDFDNRQHPLGSPLSRQAEPPIFSVPTQNLPSVAPMAELQTSGIVASHETTAGVFPTTSQLASIFAKRQQPGK